MKDQARKEVFHSLKVLCFLLLSCFLVSSVASGAQTSQATLSGTPITHRGGRCPCYRSSAATGLKRQATTNSEGIFTLPLLPPGIYALQANKRVFDVGFRASSCRVAVQVDTGRYAAGPSFAETVSVTAGATLLQTSSALSRRLSITGKSI